MENILYPLVGGVIIGLAATFMMMSIGKIAGISGIVAGLLEKPNPATKWRFAFVLGLLSGGGLLFWLSPQLFQYEFSFTYFEAIVGGLLVGFGTRLGSGCTSGHGVCGLPRLSARSFVATLTFMGVAILTVFIRGLL
tara:strand:- start:3875 stop:4285 length:411 start_codon:yes stop_codon:yes gene_type:complete